METEAASYWETLLDNIITLRASILASLDLITCYKVHSHGVCLSVVGGHTGGGGGV